MLGASGSGCEEARARAWHDAPGRSPALRIRAGAGERDAAGRGTALFV